MPTVRLIDADMFSVALSRMPPSQTYAGER
jgi:hypothetical protein